MKWESKDVFFKPVLGIAFLLFGIIELTITPLGWLHIFFSIAYLCSIRMFRNKYHIEKFQSFHISDYSCEKEWNILKLIELAMFNILLLILVKPIRILLFMLLIILVSVICISMIDLYKEQKKGY